MSELDDFVRAQRAKITRALAIPAGRLVADRLRCCVPFCRRTTSRAEFDEWLCGDHWRAIPKDARRAYGRRVRRWRRYHRRADGAAASRLWRWLKRQAIEAAAGLE